jgi:hypothetical protein
MGEEHDHRRRSQVAGLKRDEHRIVAMESERADEQAARQPTWPTRRR